MAVLSGSATLRFGVADTAADMDENTYGSGREEGGVEIEARAGDVFLIPAGVAHKTFDARPEAEFGLLTPGDGHSVAAEDVRGALDGVEISGFTMIGAYPVDRGSWDFQKGGEDVLDREKVWSVEIPECDPVLGKSQDGLLRYWT